MYISCLYPVERSHQTTINATNLKQTKMECNIINKLRQLFIIIDINEAKKRKFTFVENIYGDQINRLNCRSIWIDKKGRSWRVEQLHK